MGKSKDPITLDKDMFEEFLSKSDPASTPKSPPDNKRAKAKTAGKLGGKKGGEARAAKLTPKKRSAIAKKAARTRWGYD
jgi:hypothetical protein